MSLGLLVKKIYMKDALACDSCNRYAKTAYFLRGQYTEEHLGLEELMFCSRCGAELVKRLGLPISETIDERKE